MFASRPARPELRGGVRLLWAGPTPTQAAPWREHVLPTGTVHLALRLAGPPLRLFAGTDDPRGTAFGHAVVGGVRTAFYAREAGTPGYSVGAQLEPAACRALFGATAQDLAQRHTPLGDLWGPAAGLLIEQLQAGPDATDQLALLEQWLLARLRPASAMHPGVALALTTLSRGERVAAAVRASGLSHRHLLARFRETTGLAPKEHARILRLQHAIEALRQPGLALAEIAAGAGYADQAHFTRDFRAFAGMTPGDWRRARPVQTHHVPVPPAG
jgi:AraC-like DNA-binding protein